MTTDGHQYIFECKQRHIDRVAKLTRAIGAYRYEMNMYEDWYESSYSFETKKYRVFVEITDDAHVGGEIEVRKWRL